jgi:PAS domain S-box-containing protein
LELSKQLFSSEATNELLERDHAGGADVPLRRWAMAGTSAALVATLFVGFSCWRSVVKASKDSDWVAHTQQVRNVLETTLTHMDDVQNGTRAFEVHGDERFLQAYEEGQLAIKADIETLRLLVADNPLQEHNVSLLESQVNTKLEFCKQMIADRRRTGSAAPSATFLESDRLMKAVRATLALMDGVERKLLQQRTEESEEAQHRTKIMIIVATVATVIFLSIAGAVVRRQANHSARLRMQLKDTNAELERRVDERTSALRESEERFRLLFDVVKDYAIYMLDPTGRVLSWNAGAERMKGYSSEEIIGRDFACFYTPEAQACGKPRQELDQALSKGRFEEEALRVRKDGNAFWAQKTITPIYEDGGALRGFSVIARDNTERRNAEEEIRNLNQQLEQRVHERTAELEATNKELEAFTYSVSHDLRAPLRHIAGFSKMLIEEAGGSLKPEARHYLQRIQEGTHRMGALVDDLLSLTRIGRHELRVQVTGIESIISDVIDELRPDTEDRTIKWKVGALPFVEGDPALLKVVFQNLLSNAVKYTRPRPNAVIEVGTDQIDGKQVIYVRDNGVGFNMKYADKLFGVFQRLHRAEDFEGTGVGLATVQRIIQKHGGRIWVEAELDKGATFYLTVGNTKQEKEINQKPAMAAEAR